MEDPKVKPKLCQTENCFNHVAKGKVCPNCTYKELVGKKKQKAKQYWDKKPKTPLQKAISKAEHGKETAEKLYKKALVLWSDLVRPEEDRCNCQTCGKPLVTRGEGLDGAHGGHYLDKSNHWKLALETINGLEQCRGCNSDFIHNPRKIELMKIEMRAAMVKRFGREAVDKLDADGEKFRIDVKQGRENSKPRTHDPMAVIHGRPTDIEFLKAKIEELKLNKKVSRYE